MVTGFLLATMILGSFMLEAGNYSGPKLEFTIASFFMMLVGFILFIRATNMPKAHIICKKDQIRIGNTVLPLSNIECAIVIILLGQTIIELQIYTKDPNQIYKIETLRMPGLLSMVRLIYFLEASGINVTYNKYQNS